MSQPRKPIESDEQVIRYVQTYECPICGGIFTGRGLLNYCSYCGQSFKDAEMAKLLNNTGRFLIIDWCRGDGSGFMIAASGYIFVFIYEQMNFIELTSRLRSDLRNSEIPNNP